MFILRKITGDGVELNFDLGDSYTLIHKTRNPKDWERLKDMDEKSFAVIFYNGGADMVQIFKGQTNYVMTGEGKTFGKIYE